LYLLKLRGRSTPAVRAGGERPSHVPNPTAQVTFAGRDPQHVRKLALGWWYQHRDEHGLFMRDFFARCRMSNDGRTISYYAR